LETKRDLLDPQRVLDRGYALVWSGDRVVRSDRDVRPGDDVDVTVAEGEFQAKVLDSEHDEDA
jgi:exonuclease VII large subunit